MKYFILFLALSISLTFFFATGCASTAKREGTGEYLDDSVITTKVKAQLLNEPYLSSSQINVETYKGEVQLSGFVDTRTNINRAVEIARNVPGVKSVKNKMQLR
jgi:osmotically-inducible protein OsmY